MLDYKIMYVSHTGNTQRLAVCIYQSLQQLGNGTGRSHCLEPADSGRVRNTMTELWKM